MRKLAQDMRCAAYQGHLHRIWSVRQEMELHGPPSCIMCDGQPSASRVRPSLVRKAPIRHAEALKGEKGKGGIMYASYYNCTVEMQITVPVGRKCQISSRVSPTC